MGAEILHRCSFLYSFPNKDCLSIASNFFVFFIEYSSRIHHHENPTQAA